MKNYLPHLDGLRAFAVLLVLCSQLKIYPFLGGYIGVDMFFVISGFLITRIIINELNTTNSFSFLNFTVRRFKRLLPNLITVVALCLALGFIFFSSFDYEQLAGTAVYTLTGTANFYFVKHSLDYWNPSNLYNPFLHTWSLAVEEQFYLLWPLCLLFLLSFVYH